MKTSELTCDNLGYAVALIEYPEWKEQGYLESVHDLYFDDGAHYAPWQNWTQGGPIIERENIAIAYWETTLNPWKSWVNEIVEYGPTPLIAAMRCYVASKLGDDVDVPEELIKPTKGVTA